jgi:hypothetical protein
MSVSDDKVIVERSIESMMYFRHPRNAGVVGVGHSSPLRELKIIRMHSDGYSLSEVVLRSPE